MTALTSNIARALSEWDDAVVERAIFGTVDPKIIATEIAATCINQLHCEPVGSLFYTTSVKAVAGLILRDDRRVVLKAFQPRWSYDFLSAIQMAAGRLAAEGLPCPRPLGEPVRLARGFATFEEFLPEPFPMKKLVAADLRRMAAGLALQVELARHCDIPAGFATNPMRIKQPQRIYPEPHSPLFDFDRTAAGAEWIDNLAALALRVRDRYSSNTVVVAHMDWCARNVRLKESGIAAVYDMDSLDAVPETTAVGQAAASWRLTLEDDNEVHPSLHELLQYVDSYEAARGATFSSEERAAATAAGLWLIAYTARCEHAGGSQRGSAMPRLREDGERFKDLLAKFL